MSADAIAQKITPPTNPLAELEALETAYEKKWILSTNQLGSILKLNSKTVIRYQSFDRHGFTFTRSGQVGAEIGSASWLSLKVIDRFRLTSNPVVYPY